MLRRLLTALLFGALFLGATYLAACGSINPDSAPPGSAFDSIATRTPFQIFATLTPSQTPTPEITNTPRPTPTPDGPPVSVEDYERLFPGVFYKREEKSSPRPHTVHIVLVELNKQSIDLMVTPREGLGQTTSNFLESYGLQLAINGDGWVNINDPIGFAVSDGEVYSEDAGTPTIYILKNGRVKVGGILPEKQIQHAISGSHLLVRNGQVDPDIRNCTQPDVYCEHLRPRTSIGISAGNYLIIVLVEGPPSDPRAALTLEELAKLHILLGSVDAIAMDGGGSTTLVIDRGDGAEILNSPTDGSERTVSNHLGIFVRNRGN